MKNKPVPVGYKFFVLAVATLGFIINFTPDGRLAEKNGNQEYEKNGESGKIQTMILHVVQIINRFRETQQHRISTYQRSTRNNNEDTFNDTPMSKFVIAMDNYFTLPNVMKKLREFDIGVVGTSHFKRNWPPKEMRNINVDEVNFNEFHYCYDEHGTLLGRWMDNSLVFCVSTVHRIGNVIKRMRKRPRYTTTNKRHVREVWGDDGKKEINIPTLIDHYNHWMGGVDLVDQLIAYYHADCRCLRTWVPMFVQIVSMIRTNCYVVYKKHQQGNKLKVKTHKLCTLDMVSTLLQKATAHETRMTRKRTLPQTIFTTGPSEIKIKKSRKCCRICLQTFDTKWSIRHNKSHQRLPANVNSPGSCVQCCKLKLEQHAAASKASSKNGKGIAIDWTSGVKRTAYACKQCTENNLDGDICFLCKEHFNQFHNC